MYMCTEFHGHGVRARSAVAVIRSVLVPRTLRYRKDWIRTRHVHRSREHVLCRTGGCMRHETCNANGHSMACNGRIPTSAVSQGTIGRIPPTCQQPRASVKILNVSNTNTDKNDTLLFLDCSSLIPMSARDTGLRTKTSSSLRRPRSGI